MQKSQKTGVIVLGAGIIGLGLFFIARSAKRLKDLTLSVEYVHLDSQKSSVNNTALLIGINIYNPNTEPIPFESFMGNIYMYDKLIANIDPYRNLNLVLKGRQSTIIKLAVNLPNSKLGLSILTSLSDLLTGNATKIPINMKGELKAGGLTVPINQDLSIDLSQ